MYNRESNLCFCLRLYRMVHMYICTYIGLYRKYIYTYLFATLSMQNTYVFICVLKNYRTMAKEAGAKWYV